MVICALSLLGLLSCATTGSASIQIIRDTNTTSIDYEPPEAWIPSSTHCATCPPSSVLLNGNGTWHNGTNTISHKDEDDISRSIKKDNKGKGGKPAASGDDDGPDSDDPNFVPMPVSVTFRFSASSFVLHALVPTFILPSDAPSNTNISFMLDGISTGPAFVFTPTAPGIGFKDAQVLLLSGLDDHPHVVVGNLAPGSTFLVSYVNLTTKDTPPNSSSGSFSSGRLTTSASSTVPSNSLASGSPSPSPSKKNVASFAATIGFVGCLSIVAFCTFLSICCRRRRYRKRDALIRAQEEATQVREFGGRVHGPRPFVPRYFPGTLPPFDVEGEAENIPPPYAPSEHPSLSVIAPLLDLPPPPPPPPLPPPALTDSLQVREVPSASLISIVTVRSAPFALRRSSVISLISPSHPAEAEAPIEESQQRSVTEPTSTEEQGDSEVPIQEVPFWRPQTEMREDETSDTESGGLLSSEHHDRIPVQNG